MNLRAFFILTYGLAGSAVAQAPPEAIASVVDFRYAPEWWQTLICLADDPQKTLVGKDGGLLYQYGGGPYQDFQTEVVTAIDPALVWDHQELESPRVPIVETFWKSPDLEVEEDAFSSPLRADRPLPSCDVVLVKVHSTASQPSSITPYLVVRKSAKADVVSDSSSRQIAILKRALTCSLPFQSFSEVTPTSPEAVAHGWFQDKELVEPIDPKRSQATVAALAPIALQPGQETEFALACGSRAPITLAEAHRLRDATVAYWNGIKLPYGHVEVPDAGVQAMLDGCLRNIWQAREIKKGLPSFQVGPTCYRGLWAIDGSFILETVAMLDDVAEARAGMNYYLSQEHPDGSFQMIKGHNKENGIALWAATHHARLTGDKKWLESVWPALEKTIHHIEMMNRSTRAHPSALTYNLMPAGFIDGGLEQAPDGEYSTVYWTLIGLKSAAQGAAWLGKDAEAKRIQALYDSMDAQFRQAARRDTIQDSHLNRCLPMAMGNRIKGVNPQRGQWPFCHAVYPGQLFEPGDPVLTGNMAMLKATEQEGMVVGTGWEPAGIWNYFASFYAHDWLWLGDGPKAWDCLVAFANHASPLLVWREEQNVAGQPFAKTGDMPHNWASAEFIRLTIHLLAFDNGRVLHLLEGLPRPWLQPGDTVALRDIRTIFGTVNLQVTTPAAGGPSHLHMESLPSDSDCQSIVVHRPDGSTRAFSPGAGKSIDVDLN